MDEEKKFRTEVKDMKEINYNLQGEKLLLDVEPGEEVVISGVSGALPDSNNMHEYRDNLFNKVNMVGPNRRYNTNHPEIPPCTGTIPSIDKYDTGFFGVHHRQADSLHPQLSLLQEKTLEAIFDAGLHPSDLENTRTGVFIGMAYTDNVVQCYFHNLTPETYTITGIERSMTAQRLSYFLKLKGPSYTLDTACSSTLYALDHAYKSLRLGEIDNAIVGGTNLCLIPLTTLQFSRLGVLNMDGKCMPFDADGKGYARSETIGAIFLQKAKNAKRLYCKVVHVKTSCDGYKEQGITFPSKDAQAQLLSEFYDVCNIDKNNLSFLETHGTGTIVGDIEECFAIDSVLTKERTKPLLIGSAKSNAGHSEPASAATSILKCIIGMEAGFIPPNIHYKKPRETIKSLVEGRLKVVSEKIPFEDNYGLIGVNNFGFGGSNSHLLMQWNLKTKGHNSDPSNNLPRLVCVSGRTEEAVISLIDSATRNKFDDEYITLLHNAFRKNVQGHQYRGYTIVSRSEEITRSTNLLKYFPTSPRPLCIVFGKLKSWRKIGTEFMALPMFTRYIQSIQRIITKKVNIEAFFRNETSNEDVGDVLGNVLLQLGLMHIFHDLELAPPNNMGLSVGQLISAYLSKSLSLEEIVNYAYFIDEAISKITKKFASNNIPKSSETISGKHKTKRSVTENNCTHNNTSTYKSEVDELNNFSIKLTNNNSEWTKQNLIEHVSQALLDKGYKNLKVKQIVNAIFERVNTNIEVNPQSVIINLDDSKLITSANCSLIPIFNEEPNYLICFLHALGRLYEHGYNPQINKLYPSVEWPVSRGTEMISPYIKWNHSRSKNAFLYKSESRKKDLLCRTVIILLEDHLWNYLEGHVIDGINLFPATAFIYLVWETFALIHGIPIVMANVCFKNCKFIRAVTIPKKESLKLTISIQSGSKDFEVIHEDSVVVTGNISLLDIKQKSSDLNQYKNNTYTDCKSDNVKLTRKDFYKELRLRGYGYKKAFQAVKECNITATSGYIKWEDNWVTFMDSMMQMNILQYDTRLLYVPTLISKLTIIVEDHLSFVNSKLTEEIQTPNLPVESDIITGKLSSVGITFWGLTATAISRKKIMNNPVLESYTFLPNSAVMDIHHSMRVNMQIILENAVTYSVKAVEVIDNITIKNALPLMPIIKSVLEDQPLIQPLLKIFTKTPIDDVSVETVDDNLNSESDCLLVIASNIMDRPHVIKEACSSLVPNGFIISREPYNYDVSRKVGDNLKVFTIHRTENESILLLQKQTETKQFEFIKINSDKNFAWLPELQNAINKKKDDVILYAENEPNNGILGLVNCLRREPLTKNVRCVFIMDKTEEFNPHIPLYSKQLEKQMAVNIYKYGQWGTYRHLPLNSYDVESEHCFLNVTSKGDLSSLRWTEGPLRHHMKHQPEKEFVYVYYASLNFRDIMTATGKINVDVITRNRLEQECVQGLEFSGRNSRGNRVMGMTTHGALSTLISCNSSVIFKVPENWSLEEAATVPAVYGTVIYALILRGKMARGESILIHSGTGGVGQAAIRLALHYGCEVFTTVGTKEKRDVLKKIFPRLKDHHIGNSHDESFEQLVLRGTNGHGVDLVLNSLAEEKLQASVRCLAKGGRFIEIGKFDLARNNEISALLFQKEASFHGVMLDHLFAETPTAKQKLISTMEAGIKNGVIKPLSRTVFKYDEVEQAFRFMAKGRHMGKVLVQVREPQKEPFNSQLNTKFVGMTRYFCNAEKVYIIIGGLGGFGLELADWLILRGARKLVLVSRKGVTTGYQSYRLRIWKTYGVEVKISTSPITTREGCEDLIKESLLLGSVDAIFNLAVVLADSLLENQTPENFAISFGPKAYAAEYLDEITRQMCPNLSEFVMFSSVSCGRGNGGQTNYGMSNSVMERICENRKNSGYPALAIEWGAVGEVGLVAEMLEIDTEVEISGTLQQKISSCLQTMDILLREKEASIVSSMVVAEKRSLYVADNVVDAVINIIGIKDSKSISFHSTLAELGMDSMTSVEIKELLERDFEIFLSPKNIRTMTLAKLQDIGNKMLQQDNTEKKTFNLDIGMLVKANKTQLYSSKAYVELKSTVPQNAPTVLMFPGIEGFAHIYEGITENLNAYTIGVQLLLDNKFKSIADMAEYILPTVKKFFPDNKFILVAYSYGTLIALEVVNILESCGYKGTLICIDGAPSMMKKMVMDLGIESESTFETTLVYHMLSNYIPPEIIKEYKESFYKCTTWKNRVDLAIEIVEQGKSQTPEKSNEAYYLRLISNSIYNRAKALLNYTPKYSKLITNIVLIKPSQESVVGLSQDYELSQYFEKPIQIHTIEGNHVTIIENKRLQELINVYTQDVVHT